MTSIIRLQPFNGVDGEGPPCYMLQLDEFKFLLDCGWNPDFDMGYIENLKKHLHQIDAVLLSHPDPYHLGALPYLVGKAGLSCPIYATVPVYKMGQMFMYDLFQSRHNTEEFSLFTLDDVDIAFEKIQQLKYSQTIGLKGKGHGLHITPLSAGHIIGGTIWKIVKDGEEEIVYAVDYNHKKERHLNGCVLDQIIRPSILITDAYNANYTQARRRLRDEQLMTNIMQTLRNDGNVLVTVDSAGRVLELAHLLDQMWRTPGSGLIAYSVALLNNVSYNVVEFAKSQVEWMSDKIQRAFEDQRNNPFQFKHLQLCHSIAELNKIPSPKVVLASTPDMQCGFSRDLFFQWSSNPKNTVIITQKASPGTLARWLVDHPDQTSITLKMNKRVRLEGVELEIHRKRQKEKAAEELKKQAQTKAETEGMISSDDSDDDDLTDASHLQHDLMGRSEAKVRHGFFKQSKRSHPMYPVVEERIKWDDYGEIIKIEDFQMLDQMTEEALQIARAEKEEEPVVEELQEPVEIPTKCVSTSHNLDILARIVYIDFEGRSDGDSIRNILAKIKPRHLILVHGSFDATASLADYARCTKDVVQGNVYTPSLHEMIDATTESHIYQARLKDSVVSALTFSKARDTELSWIDGMIDMSKAKTDIKTKQDTEGGSDEEEEAMDVVPTLVPLSTSEVPFHKAVYVNEPRLSDFKQVLVEEGIHAEFSGGVLICNNRVAIRRSEAGKMLIEGSLCQDFYTIQDLLNKQYAIL